MALVNNLASQFLSAHPGEAARAVEALSEDERREVLSSADSGAAAAAIQAMDPSVATIALLELGGKAPPVIEQMQFDLALLLLRRMEKQDREALLKDIPESLAELFARRLRYPEGTAGSVMDPSVTEISSDITVAAALAHLRDFRHSPSPIVYVIDRAQRLVGVLTLGQLFRADESAPVSGIMVKEVRSIPASITTMEMIANPGWNRFHRLPVVDEAQRLIGIIRYETVRRLLTDAARRAEQNTGLGTILSLGQLYWNGLSELLGGITPESRHASPDDRRTGHE